ncbi:Spy/CpxP family protein refolding chaperone [Motilimonas pumila]|uniref:Periplasmic heavy metal sensor n=1 Tax=Motilimonas pumila TaxID=2303987 RepID=A0A418YB36_9GAMM|nr:Spy/CpxP family protein refolding chaperone [Motilimonas pumila]RJG40183.1 hypothetical protein D1Z90_16715 [Motilimonas pumila]
MKKQLIALTIAATVFSGAALAKGHHQRGGHGEMQNFVNEYVLQLTDAQQTQADQIKADTKAKLKALKPAKEQRQQMAKLSPDDSEYQSQMAVMAKAKGERVEQMMLIKADAKAQFFAILTPEQKQQWQEFKQKQAEKKPRGKGKGKGERHCPTQ